MDVCTLILKIRLGAVIHEASEAMLSEMIFRWRWYMSFMILSSMTVFLFMARVINPFPRVDTTLALSS
jgi:hypothetical protein